MVSMKFYPEFGMQKGNISSLCLDKNVGRKINSVISQKLVDFSEILDVQTTSKQISNN